MNIDNLMFEYTKLNEKLAESNRLNEKIFREMIWEKSRKKFDVIALNDYGSLLISIVMLGTGIYFTAKHRDDSLLFLVSMISLFAWTGLIGLILWPMILQMEIKPGDESISETLEKIGKLHKTYSLQRNLGMLMMPVLMFIVPVLWKGVYNYDFLEIFKNVWAIGYVALLIFLGIIVLPFVYKITYFKWLNDARRTLNQLDEELLFLKE